MAALLLGPVLRHVGSTDATIWVETDAPCTVSILGHSSRTWCVAGHYYALIVITGLRPLTSHPYQVHLDDVLVWPQPEDPRPAPRVRTLAERGPVRIAFGSCRYARSDSVAHDHRFEPDAVMCFARQLAEQPPETLPDALVFLGDQVYADETTKATQQRIKQRRDITIGAKEQVADFEEYTWLYAESWTDPDVRWLMSTVGVSMIFDDHDVRDDWNTSRSWRSDMQATEWWSERIMGALASYWVYQHLGNLSPAELAANELFQKVQSCSGDANDLLREFAAAADREADGAKGARWSYRRDFGRVRLLMIDSRCGRILDGERSMLGAEELDWIIAETDGDYDHLLIGTSLPWLLAPALHDLECWNEKLADGARGQLIARWSEKLRRAGDLEHWAAFKRSFDALGQLIVDVADGRHTEPGHPAPATVCVLSGDVHHAYVSQAHFEQPTQAAVYQLTCSPVHNFVPRLMKLAFRLAWSPVAERTVRRLLALITPVPSSTVRWQREAGPFFGNELMTFVAEDRSAVVELAKTRSNHLGEHHSIASELRVVHRQQLSGG